MTEEERSKVLSEVGGSWLYGQGMGETVLNVGTVVVFPPYALVLVGNAALSLAGYEPLSITDALPEEPKQGFNSVYNAVTEAPGRVTAALAEKEFRAAPVAQARLKELLDHIDERQQAREKISQGKK